MRGGANTLKLNDQTVSYIISAFEFISNNIGKDRSNSLARNKLDHLKKYKDIPYPVFQLDKGSKGEKAIHFYKLTIENKDTTDPTFTLRRENVKIPVTCGMTNCKTKEGKVLDLKLANEIVKEQDGVYESLITMIDEVYEYATKDPSYWWTVPTPFEKNNQETPEEKKERQERQRLKAEEREKEVQDRDKKIEQVKEEQKAFSAQIAKDQAENNPYNKYKDMTDDAIKTEYNKQKEKLNTSSEAITDKKKASIDMKDLAQTFNKEIAEAFNKSEDLKEFFTKEYNEYVVKAKEYATKEKKWLER
tara:strand:- start:47 stop:958 length:912 start_codon:yes stop_codon:yes gene_type:complete